MQKSKIFILTIGLLLLLGFSVEAVTVQIGSGTGTTNVMPIRTQSRYSYSQQIYTQAQINRAGAISSLNLYFDSGSSSNSNNWVVYLGHTTKTSFSSTTDWVASSALTQVFSGTVTIPNPGWMTVTFSTPFVYNNTSNLVVAIDENNRRTANQAGNWYSFSSASNTGIYYYGNTNANPASPPSATGRTGSLNQIRLNMPVADPTAFTASTLSDAQIGLSWLQNSASDNVMVAVNSSNSFGAPIDGTAYPVNSTISGGGTVIFNGSGTSFTHSSLNPNTTYYYRAWSVSNSGVIGYSPGQSANATTNVQYTVSPLSISRTLAAGAGSEETVTINNTGSGTLIISNITDNANWLSVANSFPFNLAPGTNQAILLNIDTSGLAGGNYSANLVITTNSSSTPATTVLINLTVDTSIPNDPRFVAEWEPAKGAIVGYSGEFGLPNAMLRDLSNQGLLYVVRSSTNATACTNALNSASVNMTNVRCITQALDSYWIRDYGPMTIFNGNNSMGIVDFTYNRPRSNDNASNQALATYLGLNRYFMPMIQTGGDMMTDGYGKAMSTNLVVNDNDGSPTQTGVPTPYYNYSQAQIDAVMQQYLGVTEYQKYADPLSDSTLDHIDCWAKLIDVDKVMITRVPSGNSNYAAIEASVAAWQSRTSSYGTPYRIYRVDAPTSQPYSNAYIYNKRIYVPQMASTASAADIAAVNAYKNAMPGYTVQGYYWTVAKADAYVSTDAIHCRVNTIYDPEMVHLKHIPIRNAVANSFLTITTEISSTYSVSNDSTYVSYRYWNQSSSSYTNWQTVPLTLISGATWGVQIPTPAAGDSLHYTIRATDTMGKTCLASLCGRLDPYRVKVDEYHYRTKVASGTWENIANWEYTNNGSVWNAASLAPTPLNSSSITIISGHVISMNSNATADQMTIQPGAKLVIGNAYSLTLANGTGTDLQMNGYLTITGNISFETGATMLCGDDSTVEFNGSAAQVTGSGFPSELDNLILNNSSGVILNVDTHVNGTLTQTAGTFVGAVMPDGYQSLLYHLSFPETGVRISNWDISMTTNSLMPDRINRQWNINGSYTGTKTLTFTWDAEDDLDFDWAVEGKTPALYKGLTKLSPLSYDVTSDPRTMTVEVSSVLTKGAYTIGSSEDGTLPVELSAFTAVLSVGNVVNLQWITHSETNVVGYRIYRGNSEDFGSSVLLNAFINATNTSQTQVYVFSDKEVTASGKYYYWLENLDLDGTSQLHGPITVLVSIGDPGTPGIPVVQGINRSYPNPFNPRTRIQIGILGSGQAKLTVYNLRGQPVKVLLDEFKQEGTYSLDWDGTDSDGKPVSSGLYQLVLQHGGKQFSKKLTLVK